MNNITEKIAAVLNEQSFYDENKDLGNPAEIIEAIQSKVPEATSEDIDLFLTRISEQIQRENGELMEDDLDEVAGGFGITITVAGVVTAVKIAAAAGTVIGGALWYWKHRKCI